MSKVIPIFLLVIQSILFVLNIYAIFYTKTPLPFVIAGFINIYGINLNIKTLCL